MVSFCTPEKSAIQKLSLIVTIIIIRRKKNEVLKLAVRYTVTTIDNSVSVRMDSVPCTGTPGAAWTIGYHAEVGRQSLSGRYGSIQLSPARD